MMLHKCGNHIVKTICITFSTVSSVKRVLGSHTCELKNGIIYICHSFIMHHLTTDYKLQTTLVQQLSHLTYENKSP